VISGNTYDTPTSNAKDTAELIIFEAKSCNLHQRSIVFIELKKTFYYGFTEQVISSLLEEKYKSMTKQQFKGFTIPY